MPSASFPGPKSAQMLDELAKYVIAEPYPFVLDLERCEGMWLATVDGQRLFDWCGYYGSKLLGHNHPGMLEPGYVKRLVLAANNKVANPDFLTPECLEYYRLLFRLAPEVMKGPDLEVYSVNSGAEAVENMMKYMVAMFNQKRLKQGKTISNRRFLYFDRAFHGRTVFALNVTQTMDPIATRDFHGLTHGGNIMLPFPAFDSSDTEEANRQNALKSLGRVEGALELMRDEVVGMIVEPIQGAGGQRVAVPEFFQGLSRLAKQYDVYLAFDEVQTGLGLTGKMWGIDHFDLPYPPIAVASGKKFGNGVVYMHEHLADIGLLDSTWGGTLVDMVRVVREMEIVEQDRLIEQAAEKGTALVSVLNRVVAKHHEIATNVRGLGLYQGFSLDSPARKAEVIRVARDEFGLLLLGAGHRSIRTRPNLNVTYDEIEHFGVLLDGALSRVH